MNELLRAIAELVGSLAWPLVAVFAALYYRGEVTDLAKRLRKGGGAEFDPIPQPTAPPANPFAGTGNGESTAISKVTSDTLEILPRTPATATWEQLLVDSPMLKSVEAAPERERILLRMLARALLVNQFEQADASIWASQLELLTYLNSKRDGETHAQLKELFYDRAAVQFPTWYSNYAYEPWLGFLQRNSLVTSNAAMAQITDIGIEYLTWRVQQARPPKLQG